MPPHTKRRTEPVRITKTYVDLLERHYDNWKLLAEMRGDILSILCHGFKQGKPEDIEEYRKHVASVSAEMDSLIAGYRQILSESWIRRMWSCMRNASRVADYRERKLRKRLKLSKVETTIGIPHIWEHRETYTASGSAHDTDDT
jgi:hypothetical protein